MRNITHSNTLTNKKSKDMELRKVKFKKWIPSERKLMDGRYYTVSDTNCYEEEYSQDGFFHQWITREEGDGTNIFAIIELPDGTIKIVQPHVIKFINQ